MNQQQIRCDSENGATDLPLIAKKTLSVLCNKIFLMIKKDFSFAKSYKNSSTGDCKSLSNDCGFAKSIKL